MKDADRGKVKELKCECPKDCKLEGWEGCPRGDAQEEVMRLKKELNTRKEATNGKG